jgi:uncharacterized protein YhhL (DUF1145 family)
MSIFALIFILILIGVALYCVNTLVPIDGKIRTIINIVVILLVLVWLFDVFVGLGSLGTVGAPRAGHMFR